MLLRNYQRRLVDRALAALDRHGNTLAIAATGAGKTIILSGLAGKVGGKQLILQHRQELVAQNQSKFKMVNPGRSTSRYTADIKSWRGDTVFAMQQTLCRNLGAIPKLDLAIIDEAHRLMAPTYRSIIDAILDKNPDCYIAGFTATPERADKKSLRPYFSNVADQITIKELVALGFLVPPRAFVVDVGMGVQDELSALKPASAFGDQSDVEAVLNKVAINTEVVRHWREKAGDRQTIVFCSTVHHAEDVTEAFQMEGVKAKCLHARMGDIERKSIIAAHDRGEIQVLVNVAILTEGYDSQPVSCIILLRQCSDKGPMIQMAGRGLRTVDPEIYPGIVKKDCVLLDFGTSILTHGDLDQGDGLHEEREKDADGGEASTKICPEAYNERSPYKFPDPSGMRGCGMEVPAQVKFCPVCGFQFIRLDGAEDVTYVELSEINILDASPFLYVDLWGNDLGLMASGFSAWAGVFSPDKGETWYAVGKQNGNRVHTLAVTGRVQAIAAADDFLRNYEKDGSAKKSKRWLSDPASSKQIDWLHRMGHPKAHNSAFAGGGYTTKYEAGCLMSFGFAQKEIERAIGVR